MYEVTSRIYHFLICLIIGMAMMFLLFGGIRKGINTFSNYFSNQTSVITGLATGQNNAQSNFEKNNHQLESKINFMGDKSNGLVNKISHSNNVKNTIKSGDRANHFVKKNGNQAIRTANRASRN